MNKKFIICAMALTAVTACSQQGTGTPALDPGNFDISVAPGTDFYQYATGGWQKKNPLKPEFSRYGSFDVLAENNEIRLNDLFKELSETEAEEGSVEQKIADLYRMGLDSVRLNREGIAPVMPYLDRLEEIQSVEDFARMSGEYARMGIGSIYGAYVGADMMDNNNQILYLGEDGLAMHNRDYYLLPEHNGIREGYREYLAKVFQLAGFKDAGQRASDAYSVEMAIAEPFWSMERQRDIEAQYNPMTSRQVFEAYPNLHLDAFFAALGVSEQEKMVVEQLSYFEALNAILKDMDPAKLRHYLQASVIGDACGSISDDFYSASFDFFSARMAGVKEQKPRWKRAMRVPNSILGEAVGEMYVKKYFPEKDKKRMLGIVKNIQKALGEHIAGLDWMSAETKARAAEKLAAFTVKIGYPDKWKDYSSMTIDKKLSYYDNILNASRWYFEDNMSKLGKPVDKTEWHMSPQTVNAYYNPTTNEICFPAGILQPPFYNPDADDAVNYGAIGVVISHEMTHGFDDQGRLFDKDGNMNNWWSAADAEAFKAKTAVLVEQFNKIEVLPGVFANGAATLGENIADQGGLRIAYTAMQNSFAGRHPAPVDGFSAEQRFYLAYAGVWAQNITKEEIQRRVLIDVHSNGRDRVNASLRNLQTFFDAFAIGEGEAMWLPKSERVIIW